MKPIEKNFFWVVICFALLAVHVMLIVFDANIYSYWFWPYVVSLVSIVILITIVFSGMEKLMGKVGLKLLISKYIKILSTVEFWGIFILLTVLFYIDAYSFGQLFLPTEQVTKFLLPDLNEWIIYLPFVLVGTVVAIKKIKSIIFLKVNE